ncbi:MAG: S8 family serine peptidase [Sulfurimonas sp.]|nr:S8 family serine peptidase [Sulfurimonas sp.]
MNSKLIMASIVLTSLLILGGCGSDSDNYDKTPTTKTPTTKTPIPKNPSTETPIDNSLNISSEQYYKYLWHIDSQNSLNKEVTQEVSAALNNSYIIDDIDADADINILDAWKITKGKDVIIAIIDDGADVNHEDLKANIILTRNIDYGIADVSNTSNDINFASHGNTVAGFMVAPINGIGIIGTAPEAKLIIIKQELAIDSKIIKAFEFAKNNGAKVINCSWGTENVSEAIIAELKSLYEAGITVVFASGNNGLSLDDNIADESEIEWVIGVGASGENNDVTDYSNYGKHIDILAPGGNIGKSIGILGLDDTGTQGSTNNYGLVSNNYTFAAGTSFSTPVVAGVIALMYSVNPNITPKQVREILIATADKIGGNDANYQNGFDIKRAYGKINATKAIQETKRLMQ